MELNSKQRSYLKSLAHPLSPLVQMGKAGYGPTLVKEVRRNLGDHELIKVRLDASDHSEFRGLAGELAEATDAALVQAIGRIAVLYRPAPEPTIVLPRPKAKRA